MAPRQPGDRVPSVTFLARTSGEWTPVESDAFFAGRTVVVFSLPGAFTPTCSSAHVPRYNELVDAFADAGVDEIACISVNDAFVMEAWQRDQGADRIRFLPDGNGSFSEAMGLLVDKSDIGFGKRCWRYSMLVRDGIIDTLFVEPDEPGDPFKVSDADTMLQHLGGIAPPDVLLFTKPGCSHCTRAKRMLDEAGLAWGELPTSPRVLRALPGAGTTPQVFVNGAHVGGADDLANWLANR